MAKIRNIQLSEIIKIFGASLFLYLLTINALSLSIALIFDKFEKNFNQASIINGTTADFMDAFIYGSFFLAYYYYRKNQKNQREIARYNQAISESRINQLKTQLNPHFLFNNLNVLDQLIEEDKHKASGFLNEFADIYRYVLQASDKKTVPIDEELSFAENYFHLIQHKYENTYRLQVAQNEKER